MYELSIIKAFLNYNTWEKYKDKLNIKDIPKEIVPLYSALDSFHQNNKTDLTVADLANLVLAHQQKDPDYYKAVLGNLETLSVSDTTTEVLLSSIVDRKHLKEISLAAYDLTEGKGDREKFLELLKQFEQPDEPVTEDFEFVTDNLEDLLNETYRQPGLRWRLAALNRIFGSLRGGDFGFLFARPESGKTTILASEGTYMAEQLSEDDGPIIWFNNEEKGNKVKIRCYQASLGATLAQINSNTQRAQEAFLKRTKGKLLLLKDGSISKAMVEKVVKKYKPKLVIFDQIDKIIGFDADREDLKLGAMYQWARDLGKEYNYATIAVCQADGTGENQKWLTMANVANAKTAKQAEADWILGIGKIHDVGYENVRYLHASKNKLAGDADTDPNLRHGRMEVIINPSIARYEDIQ